MCYCTANLWSSYIKFLNNRENYLIAGIQEISDNLEFPVTIKTGNGNPFTFRIDEKINIARNVYLNDKTTGEIYDLANPVTLTLPAGLYEERFYITFGQVVGVGDDYFIDAKLYFDSNTKEVVLKNFSDAKVQKVEIYSLLGRKVKEWTSVKNQIENRFSIGTLASSVYVVTMDTDKGKVTKKIILH